MNGLTLYKNIMLLGSGIETCLEKELNVPALILIYSAIDTVGWLDSADENATKTSFINWVDTYLLDQKHLECTALELYAARCGLLHTSSPDSILSSSKKARRIYYAWGPAKVQDLQRLIDLDNKSTELVTVHVSDLYESWSLGVFQFVKEIEKDHGRRFRVYEKATKFFAELGSETVSKVLDEFDRTEGP